MRQKPVIADTDANTARKPPKNNRGSKVLPAKRKQRSQRQNMKYNNTDQGAPIDLFRIILDYGHFLHKIQTPYDCEIQWHLMPN